MVKLVIEDNKAPEPVIYWDEIGAVPSLPTPAISNDVSDALSGSIDFDMLARAGHFPVTSGSRKGSAFGI